MATKIMFLADDFPGFTGGTEAQLMQLVSSLDRSRYDPAMTLLRSSDYVERARMPCPVTVLDIRSLARLRSVLRFARYALDLRRRGYRLVHCFFNDVSIIAPPLLKLLGIRVLVSRRDLGYWYTRGALLALRFNAMFVDRYVTNALAVKKVVHEQEWAPERRIDVIYNGVTPPTDQTPPLPAALARVPSDAPLIGIVANLRPLKRMDTLIEAFALVRRRCPGAWLAIVGGNGTNQRGGTVQADLQAQAQALGVDERVIFTGGVHDVSPYIARFDVAVLCSETEGFSNALIEYMRAARPVVCTDVGGNPEVIEDGRNGYLVRVGDADGLAARVVAMLENRAHARQMGERARETIRSRFSDSKMVSEQMGCYDAVMAGVRPARNATTRAGGEC